MEDMGKDRLSELPDEVLVHILSFLPTVGAVRTVLLRRFGNLWASVPKIEVESFDFLRSFRGLGAGISVESKSKWSNRFTQFVRNVLLLHEVSDIDSFTLSANRVVNDSNVHEVSMWIKCALKRNAKVVYLAFDVAYPIFLPHSMFVNQSMTDLSLAGCSLFHSRQVHMKSLRRLDLMCVDLDDAEFRKLISGCPLLEELSVDCCYDMGDLSFSFSNIKKLTFRPNDRFRVAATDTINCPNLKMFDFSGDVELVTIIDLSSVSETNIWVSYRDSLTYARHFTKFMEALRDAKVLTMVNDPFLQLVYCLLEELPFPRNRWKHVKLTVNLLNKWSVLGICNLIRNSTCLEELVINHYNDNNCGDTKLYFEQNYSRLSQEVFSSCVAPHLKVVEILDVHDCTILFHLAEFLLKSAVVLEKLVIFTNGEEKVPYTNEWRFAEKLLCLPRASAEARIIFSCR